MWIGKNAEFFGGIGRKYETGIKKIILLEGGLER